MSEPDLRSARPPRVAAVGVLPIHPNGDRPAWHVRGANATLVLDDMPWPELGAAMRCTSAA